ncbi:MAG TPA: hypothetical protein VMS01_05975 [Stellaceae bacterium]|nr:hypothetical protein [Stellaceae bacterium]
MSDERVSLELLGSRVLTMTAELRDLQLRVGALEQRFGKLESRLGALEQRFGALESRFGVQEERMAAMLSLLVRVAGRIDGGVR